jgi:phosphoribosyl 1,2-cyclic phosphate phosphodiesterase
MTLKFTILGCGTSTGVPRIGSNWGACDPENPKNYRLRCSLLVQHHGENGETSVLVDTTPDLRAQLLDAKISWLDAVLYTHDHADHIHGIDDLRGVFFNGRRRIDVYHDAPTGESLRHRFSYCFESPPGSNYPPILNGHDIQPGESLAVSGEGGEITVLPFTQYHGEINSLGYRFGNVAYSPDINGLPDESLRLLEGLDVWIVDALRPVPHPSHFSLEETLEVIDKVKPNRAILTHMHIDMDYDTLVRELPEGVEPAYDGMVFESTVL